MPYEFLDDIATSDAAYEAWADTLEELFVAAGDALMNVMVEDLGTIADRERRQIKIRDTSVDMLLFEMLQELIFLKDAEQLLLRMRKVFIGHEGDEYKLAAEAYGEELDSGKHELLVDVKAVTLYRFDVRKTGNQWRAKVVLDI